jgi:hypothetical protein
MEEDAWRWISGTVAYPRISSKSAETSVKNVMKNQGAKLLTKAPEVNIFRENGPPQNGFRVRRRLRGERPTATTLENTDEMNSPFVPDCGIFWGTGDRVAKSEA